MSIHDEIRRWYAIRIEEQIELIDELGGPRFPSMQRYLRAERAQLRLLKYLADAVDVQAKALYMLEGLCSDNSSFQEETMLESDIEEYHARERLIDRLERFLLS